MGNTRVFLDINIGNAERNSQQLADFSLTEKFLEAVGPQLGLTGQLSDLDAESLDILRSSFESNKQWADKGSFLGTRPPPLNAGRVVIEIFPDVPKAAENFKCLCSGERGKGKSSGKPLHYLGTKFHRIVKGFVCQGGDIVRGDGSGGDSIYGGKFNDEQAGLKRKHTGAKLSAQLDSISPDVKAHMRWKAQ